MIFTPLMKHQRDAAFFLGKRNGGCLFMFPGSGKSLVALTWLERHKAKKILITCDKNNSINTWPEQIWRHSDYDCAVRPANPAELIYSLRPVCVVVNYEYLSAHSAEYAAVEWDAWVGDESSEFKDQRTDKYRALRIVTSPIPRRLIMNGTPVTERLEDLWPQIALLSLERLGKSMGQFRQRYMQPEPRGYGWVAQRSAFTRVHDDLGSLAYWLENDGTIKMPEKQEITVRVDMTPQQKEIDDEFKSEFAASLDGERVEVNNAAALFVKRCQLAGGIFRGEVPRPVPTAKLDVLGRIVKENPESRIVVWHHYVPETGLLADYLRSKGVSPLVFDAPTKQEVLEAFAQGESRVLLARLSLCRGLNHLVGADVAVFWSNPFSYARRAQAEGRTCRITSGFDTTTYFNLITKGGADEIVAHFLSQKQSLSLTLSSLNAIMCYQTKV